MEYRISYYNNLQPGPPHKKTIHKTPFHFRVYTICQFSPQLFFEIMPVI